MAEEQKPVATEPVAPVADAAVTETKPVESTPEAKAEAAEAPAVDAAAATEEPAKATEEPAKEAAKEVEPIYKGTLKYITGNPLKSIISKPAFQFYFGEEAVKAEDLKHTVKLQEAGGRETAAWSNETGKGVLYYIRETASKAGPPGAVLLHAVEDLKKAGSDKINFKLHGTQHNLIAGSPSERDGWYKALEEKIAEAKELKEEVFNKDSFKETLEKLTKPTGLVLGTAAVTTAAVQENIPKRSAEERKEERKARSEAKKDAKAAKDRSQSRGKKFFEQFRTKKAAAAAEEPKASTEEPAAEEGAKAVEEPAAVPEVVEPVVAEAPAAPAEEVAETAVATEAAKSEEKKVEDKKARRGSKFIDRIKSFGSPTQEKKQEDIIPPVEEVAKDAEEPAAVEPVAEAPKEEAAAAEAEPTTNGDAPAEEKAAEAAAPAEKQERRRSKIFDFTQFKLPGKGKKPEVPAKDEPAAEEATKPAAEEAKPAEEEKPAEPAAEVAAPEAAAAETTEAKEPAPKPEKKNPARELIGGLIRSGSKAIRGNRESKKVVKAPEKLEEAKTEPVEEPKVEEAKPVEPVAETKPAEVKPTEPVAIGDVVGDAVTVGTPAPASQTVTASA